MSINPLIPLCIVFAWAVTTLLVPPIVAGSFTPRRTPPSAVDLPDAGMRQRPGVRERRGETT